MNRDFKKEIFTIKVRPQRDTVKTKGACKDKCLVNKGKQRDVYHSVFCKTCGIFILKTFTKPRKGGGISCMCCNQRVRLTSSRYSGLKSIP